MAVFINMCFDDESATHISKLQQVLAEQNISRYAEWLNYAPHITLVRLDDVAPESLIPIAEHFLREVQPITIMLGGLSLFSGSHPVLWLAPVSDMTLLDAHQKLCHALEPFSVHEHYQPKKWMPHVTLAAGLDANKAVAAMSVLLPMFKPISVKMARIEVVSFPPAQVLWSETVVQ